MDSRSCVDDNYSETYLRTGFEGQLDTTSTVNDVGSVVHRKKHLNSHSAESTPRSRTQREHLNDRFSENFGVAIDDNPDFDNETKTEKQEKVFKAVGSSDTQAASTKVSFDFSFGEWSKRYVPSNVHLPYKVPSYLYENVKDSNAPITFIPPELLPNFIVCSENGEKTFVSNPGKSGELREHGSEKRKTHANKTKKHNEHVGSMNDGTVSVASVVDSPRKVPSSKMQASQKSEPRPELKQPRKKMQNTSSNIKETRLNTSKLSANMRTHQKGKDWRKSSAIILPLSTPQMSRSAVSKAEQPRVHQKSVRSSSRTSSVPLTFPRTLAVPLGIPLFGLWEYANSKQKLKAQHARVQRESEIKSHSTHKHGTSSRAVRTMLDQDLQLKDGEIWQSASELKRRHEASIQSKAKSRPSKKSRSTKDLSPDASGTSLSTPSAGRPQALAPTSADSRSASNTSVSRSYSIVRRAAIPSHVSTTREFEKQPLAMRNHPFTADPWLRASPPEEIWNPKAPSLHPKDSASQISYHIATDRSLNAELEAMDLSHEERSSMRGDRSHTSTRMSRSQRNVISPSQKRPTCRREQEEPFMSGALRPSRSPANPSRSRDVSNSTKNSRLTALEQEDSSRVRSWNSPGFNDKSQHSRRPQQNARLTGYDPCGTEWSQPKSELRRSSKLDNARIRQGFRHVIPVESGQASSSIKKTGESYSKSTPWSDTPPVEGDPSSRPAKSQSGSYVKPSVEDVPEDDEGDQRNAINGGSNVEPLYFTNIEEQHESQNRSDNSHNTSSAAMSKFSSGRPSSGYDEPLLNAGTDISVQHIASATRIQEDADQGVHGNNDWHNAGAYAAEANGW